MGRVQSNGRLIAGVSFDIPGMGYKDPQTGAITGFEADLARAVGETIFGSGARVDFLQVTDLERIQDLQEGRVDFVASQLTITPDRAEQVDFSTPYCVTREGLLVPKGSSIGRFEDLKGKRIAVTDGSVSLRRMRAALPSLPGATLVITPLSATPFRVSGRAHLQPAIAYWNGSRTIWTSVLERFEQHAPASVMARIALEHALPSDWIDTVFEDHRQRQYSRELLFSTVIELVMLVSPRPAPFLARRGTHLGDLASVAGRALR